MSRHHKRRGRFTPPKSRRIRFMALPPGTYAVTLTSVDYAELENRVLASFNFNDVIANTGRISGKIPEGVRAGRYPAPFPTEIARPKQ